MLDPWEEDFEEYEIDDSELELERQERIQENREMEFNQRSRFWEPEGGEW